MQIYEYKCPECNARSLTGHRGDRYHEPCWNCEQSDEPLRRVFSVQVQRPMQEHWNETVSEPVSSMRGFREALKRKGDAYSERTGIECNYQPIDLSDREAVGATEEGLEVTRKRLRDEGRPPEKMVL